MEKNRIVAGLQEAAKVSASPVFRFVEESNRIEGILRVKSTEVDAHEAFLKLGRITAKTLCELQVVLAPGKPLRDCFGMNVRVGSYVAPPGGLEIESRLEKLLSDAYTSDNPWAIHVEYERLHPFMDGNGRTGRALWAWHMLQLCRDPFTIPFLHRFYYQTLENDSGRLAPPPNNPDQ